MGSIDGIRYDRIQQWTLSNIKAKQMPVWADLMLRIGSALSAWEQSSKLVLALVLPTPTYSAALISTGSVLQRVDSGKYFRNTENLKRFSFLKSLPEGTPVKYWDSGQEFIGKIAIAYHSDEIVVSINDAGNVNWKDGRCVSVKAATCNQVEVDNREDSSKELFQNAVPVSSINQQEETIFVRNLVGRRNINSFEKFQHLSNVVISQKSKFLNEINAKVFSSVDQANQIKQENECGLNTLLKIKTPRSRVYNTELISSRLGKIHRFENSSQPLVIFDGALAYNNWRGDVVRNETESNVVVLLSRQEARFQAACDGINAWSDRREKLIDPTDLDLEIPQYIEHCIFTRIYDR